MGKPLKRSYDPSDLDVGDQENMDPTLLSPPSKKSKSDLDDIIKSKSSSFVLTTVKGTKNRPIHPLPSTRRFSQAAKAAPSFTSMPAYTSVARPAAKVKGVMSNRRKTTRINPPDFSSLSGQGAILPFSLDTALSGTVTAYGSNTTITRKYGDTVPKAWRFDIHEDTEDQEMEILLDHSTCTLDISDDESRISAKNDRGKENIAPTVDMGVATPMNNLVPVSRKHMMTDEPRTPLGDLNPADFYAKDCDANSFFMIPADEEAQEQFENVNRATESNNHAADNVAVGPPNYWKDLLADIEASQKSTLAGSTAPINEEVSDEASAFDIWESESAKGEDTTQDESRTLAVASNAE